MRFFCHFCTILFFYLCSCKTVFSVQAYRAGERGAGECKVPGSVMFRGAHHTGFEWPRSRKTFFLRNTSEEMLEKLPLRFVKTFSLKTHEKFFWRNYVFAMQSWTRADVFGPNSTPTVQTRQKNQKPDFGPK